MSTPRSRLRVAAYLAFVLVGAFGLLFVGGSEVLYRGGLAGVQEESRQLLEQRFADRPGAKLLFVGDSFTAGVVDPPGTWTDHLTRALAARGVAPVQVINIGFAGSDTGWHVDHVERWLANAELKPDAVMLITGANNASTYAWQTGFLRADTPDRPPAWLRAVYALPRSTIFGAELSANLLRGQVGQDGGLPTPDAEHLDIGLMRYRLESTSDYLAWTAAEKGRRLDAYVAACRAAGTEPLLGTYITDGEYETNEITRAAAQRGGAKVFDVASQERHRAFHDRGWYLEDDWHLNAEGQREFARLWADWFVTQVRPPTTEAQQ